MPLLTARKNLFTELARWMIGLGLLTGLVFPMFVVALGLPEERVFTPTFFSATLLAGALVGALNFFLASKVMRPRLRLLNESMQRIAQSIQRAAFDNDWSGCSMDSCRVAADSEDELGETAESFNHLVGALFRSHELERAVASFSHTLSTKLELESLANAALDQLIQYSHAIAGALLVEKEGELVVAASHALQDAEALRNDDHVRAACRTKGIRRVDVPPGVRMSAVLGEVAPQDVLVLPVQFKDLCVGAVILASGGRFAPETDRIMTLFGESLGLALTNALTYSQLQRIAALDPLTGAYNRRFGMSRLKEELARAVRNDVTFGLILFDIDHFKRVNDTYGHLAGDRVIVAVSRTCRRVMREGDIQVRYGGEEFLVVLAGASLANAELMAQRIRQAVEDTVIKDGQQELRVTISCGVTAYPEDDATTEEALIHHADQALYSAKEGGRNQVRLAIKGSQPSP